MLIECVGQPYSIMSAKYRSIEEIRQQKELSIGVILGSLTEANARQLQKILPDTKLNFIGYQGTHQPTQEMLAGVLDLSVDLPADSMPWVELGKLHVIGASGSVEHKNLPTWRSQGIRGFEGLVSNYQMVVRSDLSDLETQEIHGILRRAAQHSPGLSKLYQSDYCTQQDLDLKDSNALYNQWLKYWPEKLKSLR